MLSKHYSIKYAFVKFIIISCLLFPFSLYSDVPTPVLKWRNGGYSLVEFNRAYNSSPATLDVNGDGTKDIIWANYKVFAFDGKTGNTIWWFYTGTDRSNPGVRNNIGTHCSVVVSDINGDGNGDIVTAHSNGLVCAYDKNGYFLPGFPTNPTGRTEQICSLKVFDLDSDGEKEIIIGWGIANNLNCCVIEHNGTIRPGWPQYVPNENANALGIFNDNIAVGDINQDGYGELIVPSDTGKTCAYYRDGTPLPVDPIFSEINPTNTKWPHIVNYENYEYEKIGWNATGNFYMGTDQPATIADVDNDGVYEIVIVGQVFTKNTSDNLYTKPFIYNIDRTRYNKNGYNWEDNLPQSGPPLSNDYQLIPIKTTNPVVVDIDGDGYKEILSSSYDGKIHCYWLDKNEYYSWPFSVYNPSEGRIRFSSEPAVVDLDGDGNVEIIFTSWPQYYSGTSGHLFILNSQGELIHQIALPYGDNGDVGERAFDGGLALPTVDDIDGDGELEIIVGMVYAGLIVYDLPGAIGGIRPWPTGRQNFARTGCIRFHSILGDYNGDGTTDIAVWRPSDGYWYIQGIGNYPWGTSGDIPVPGDYNGDGTTDIAVWRPSDGYWYIQGIATYPWGTSGDIPVPGNYNGDGTQDIAVWRPSDGYWYIQGIATYPWGTSGDIPVPGDYNGDGTQDIAVWRPSDGCWYIQGIGNYPWGTSGDIPVPGDYNGDGTQDIAVWRPSDGCWYIQGIGNYPWGTSGDIPVPGDYNGDGTTDNAVWRPSDGCWYIQGIGNYPWGTSGDIPLTINTIMALFIM